MITKEALFGLVLWLTAAIGVGAANGGITRPEVPSRDSSSVVATGSSTPTKSTVATTRPQTILQEVFVFNERSEKVERLQSFLGANIDGHYGTKTREKHLAALIANNMETAFVPAQPNPIVDGNKRRYNISDDPTHRCPQFEPLFAQYGLEPVEVFSYIAYRESRCNPAAVNAKFDSNGNTTWTLNKNGSVDRGLIQINSCWKTVTKNVCGTGLEGLFDVHCNLKVAKYIMDNSKSGLSNWNVWDK